MTSTPPSGATIRFEDEGTLTLAPGEARALAVVGEPPAAYQIGFALLGEQLDAWLDHAVFAADPATGRAVVELHAPSQATTFRLRASILDSRGAPGASADRAVAVSQEGFATIEVTPIYAGHRPITTWTAHVAALVGCKDIVATLPEEPPGSLTATAPSGSALTVGDVPVGPSLAVIARAGHFAWGCTDATAITPGAAMKVDVTVIDKKLDLSSSTLAATFRYDADATVIAPILEKGGALLADAFVPSGSKVASVVLNGMAALLSPAPAAAFNTQRINKGWDAIAAQHFTAQSPGLRQHFELWIAAGLVQQSPSFEALLASGSAPDQATLTLTRVGSVDATQAGAEPESPLTWSAEPNDTVLMSASIAWQPSRFAAAAAFGPAAIEFPTAASIADALALAADCDGLAAAMGPFGTCDVPCVEDLCAAAITARLGSALGASQQAGQILKMGISASADATVGDHAEPVALTGHFIGDASDGSSSATLSGDLTAKVE